MLWESFCWKCLGKSWSLKHNEAIRCSIQNELKNHSLIWTYPNSITVPYLEACKYPNWWQERLAALISKPELQNVDHPKSPKNISRRPPAIELVKLKTVISPTWYATPPTSFRERTIDRRLPYNVTILKGFFQTRNITRYVHVV